MDDLKDQSAVSTTATNGVVESEEVRAQEALLGDTDPSLTSADDVAKALNVDPSHGLSEEEAKRRLAKFGPNELASAPPVPKWKKFLAQFQDPLVYLLIAATIISVIAWFIEKANAQPGAEGGEVLPFDAIVIILILIVNAVLGYMQEAKAEAAVEALAQMTAPQTSVLRDGKVMRINTADVVPGDIIVLAEGDSVSADGRLVNAASLRIAEASLTGESVPVGKKPDTLTEAKALGDRANMIFNGTSVTQGTGRAIVTGTGMNTQVGKIADMLSATEDEKTPLQKEMDYVSKILGIAVCVIAVVVLVALAVLEGFNDVHDVIDSLLLAVSLAVAAVPEGLAAILTVVLALGVQRMAAHNAIVKKLHSVETLGSASVICSDKTGTLTRNEMTVERVVTPSGEVQITGTGYAPEGRMVMTGGVSPESEQAQIVADEVVATLVAGTLANDGELREENGRWEIVGDPTEVSLIVAARKVKADRKIKRYTRVGEIPFTSERKRMSIIAKDSTDSDKLTVFAKGAPDVLLSYCTRIRVGGQVRKLTEGDRQSILATVERLSSEAYRTLGEACRPLETGSLADVPGVSVNAAGQVSDIADQAEAIETDLIWNGMVGIIDPPRTEVRDSVTEAHRAGIRTVMITGDHPLTAARIASDLGIIAKDGKALTGDQLDQLPDEAALDKATSEVSVYARVAPEHKLKIVESLQRQGNTRGHDRRRCERCPGSQVRGHRRGHGHHRHGGVQGRRLHDPGRRQLCHHRQGGGQRPQRLRQHQKCHPVPSLGQHRRHFLRALRFPAGPARALPAGAPAVHQPAHRFPARHRHRHGARPEGPAGPKAPEPQGAHSQPAPPGPHRRPGRFGDAGPDGSLGCLAGFGRRPGKRRCLDLRGSESPRCQGLLRQQRQRAFDAFTLRLQHDQRPPA